MARSVYLKHAEPYCAKDVVRGPGTARGVCLWQRVWQNQLLQVCHQGELLVGSLVHQPGVTQVQAALTTIKHIAALMKGRGVWGGGGGRGERGKTPASERTYGLQGRKDSGILVHLLNE